MASNDHLFHLGESTVKAEASDYSCHHVVDETPLDKQVTEPVGRLVNPKDGQRWTFHHPYASV